MSDLNEIERRETLAALERSRRQARYEQAHHFLSEMVIVWTLPKLVIVLGHQVCLTSLTSSGSDGGR